MNEENWLLAQVEAAHEEFLTWSPWKQRAMLQAVDASSGSSASLHMYPPDSDVASDANQVKREIERD